MKNFWRDFIAFFRNVFFRSSFLIRFVPRDLGIDLGTANTLIYMRGRGVVLNEPSVVALLEEKGEDKVLAVGVEAKMMLGRTPKNLKAVRPLRDGVIASFDAAQKMIRFFIKKVQSDSIFASPRVIVCVPSGATEVERRAIQEAAESAGARKVFLIDEPMAAAIGAGLPVTEPRGSMVVDIGGGTTEIAVISLGSIVYSNSLRVGGDTMDEQIIEYVRRKKNILIGEGSAENIKKNIGSAVLNRDSESIQCAIKGRSLMSGIPQEVMLSQADVVEALAISVHHIIDGVKRSLEQTPPELASDIFDYGITLTGGGALLRSLSSLMEKKISVKVHVAENALLCVVEGTGKALDQINNLHSVLK